MDGGAKKFEFQVSRRHSAKCSREVLEAAAVTVVGAAQLVGEARKAAEEECRNTRSVIIFESYSNLCDTAVYTFSFIIVFSLTMTMAMAM